MKLDALEKIAFDLCNDMDNNNGKGCSKGECMGCGRYEAFKIKINKYIEKLKTSNDCQCRNCL